MTSSTTLTADPSVKQHYFEGFPVGYYDDLHPDAGMTMEMNRFSTGEPDMIEEIRSVSPRIHDLKDYTREFLALGQAALKRGEKLKGACYLRGAEFCMFGDDPRKQPTRREYIQLMREHFGFKDENHFNVPYEGGTLSAYRLPPPAQTKGRIVVFGGFDSYIEEWFPMQRYFADVGYDVVAFDGPGQGSTLHDSQLHFTPEWHKPVAAVLDYFKLDDVTLWGISFGGCLVVRAAAYEPRVRRIVCDNICTEFFEVWMTMAKPAVRAAVSSLVKIGADNVIDILVERAMKGSVNTAWGVQQGLQVMGSKTPSELFNNLKL